MRDMNAAFSRFPAFSATQRSRPAYWVGIWLGLLLLVLTAFASAATTINTFAGNLIPEGTATNIGVGASGVAVDASGDVYFADSSNHTIRKVKFSTGSMTVLAGTGTSGFSGDGSAATSAQLNSPKGVAIDSSGNIYIADTSNHRIRKIDAATGNISTIAGTGTGTGTFGGDNAAATAARVNSPQGIAVDSSGNVFIADTSNNRIRKITAATGNISTVAGNGTGGYLGDNVAATGTRINAPRGVVVDSSGNFYIADSSNNRIRKVDTGGTITTVVGTGTASFSGDNGAATSATIRAPQAIAMDGSGNLYIADTTNHRIRKVSGGIITTLAGTGAAGYGGDNGVATSGQLSSPAGIAVDASGKIYIGDTGNTRVRKIESNSITTFAGTGSPTYGGDGGSALNAQFTTPQGIVFDGAGNTYLADGGSHRIRKIDANGNVTTIAGTGVAGFSGDNGPATSAQLNTPLGISRDTAGNLYIADGNNNRIRKIDTNGIMTTFAGDGTGSFGGDNGAATSAQLFGPFSVHAVGNVVYIADTGNNRIRKVDAGGTITTIAGTGGANFAGDNGLATAAQFNTPIHVTTDSGGNIYVSDYSNGAIRKININTGIITTVAGTGSNGYGGDNGLATSAQLNSPRSAGLDAAGNLYITDTTNNRIRVVDTNGIITTFAGNGTAAFSGDSGPAGSAQVSTPQNITVVADGTVYFADTGNRRFRRVVFAVVPDAPTAVSAVAGTAQATVSFTAPASNGGATITGYTVTSNPAGGIDSNAGSTALSHLVTGLTNGVAYTFTVTATNIAGTGAASAASNSVTPVVPSIATVPDAPVIGTATAGNAQATVSFSPGFDGYATISGYTVTSNPPGGIDTNAGSTGTTHLITGLSNYTAYTFTVTASNRIGTSAPSAPSNSITPAAAAPVCTLATSAAKIAAGGVAVLTANCAPAATSYAWTNTGFGTTVSSGTVSPATTTTYAVTGSNSAGTGNTAVVTLTVPPPVSTTVPACTLTASPASIGRGRSTYLFATCSPAATSYTWTNSGFSTSTAGGRVKPTTTTTYSVIGSNAKGSGNVASATVIVSDILSSTAPALFVNASTSASKTSLIRIINTANSASVVSATAFDEGGNLLGTSNAVLGPILANQTLNFSSADLERLIDFTPGGPTAKYTVYFYADVPALQIINYTRDIATGALTLGQAVNTDRSSTATDASVTRSAWLMHSSASPTKTSVLRLVNTSDQSGTLRATLFDDALGGTGTPVAIAPRQMISYTSAELESVFGFQPAATDKYRVTFNADLPSLELIDFTKDPGSGILSLAQAQIDDRPASTTANSTRNVLSVLASTHPTSTTALRVVNPNAADAALTATAYDEAGAVLGSGSLGSVAATRTLTLASAQIEMLLGYRPASPSALARLVINANVPTFEVLNHNRLLTNGNLTLAQAQTDSRPAGTATTTTTRNAYIVYPSTNSVSTTELRIINTSAQTATLTATAYADSGTLIGGQEIGRLKPNQMLTLTSAQLERLLEYVPAGDTLLRVIFSAPLPGFELINYAKDVGTGNLVLAQPQTE